MSCQPGRMEAARGNTPGDGALRGHRAEGELLDNSALGPGGQGGCSLAMQDGPWDLPLG